MLFCSITPESGDGPKNGFELVLNWRGNFGKMVRGEPPPNQIERKNAKKQKKRKRKKQIKLLFRNYVCLFALLFLFNLVRGRFDPDQFFKISSPIQNQFKTIFRAIPGSGGYRAKQRLNVNPHLQLVKPCILFAKKKLTLLIPQQACAGNGNIN